MGGREDAHNENFDVAVCCRDGVLKEAGWEYVLNGKCAYNKCCYPTERQRKSENCVGGVEVLVADHVEHHGTARAEKLVGT